MAASATTVAQPGTRSTRLDRSRSVGRSIASAAADWWGRLAVSGQLGIEREREIGRHTGARC